MHRSYAWQALDYSGDAEHENTHEDPLRNFNSFFMFLVRGVAGETFFPNHFAPFFPRGHMRLMVLAHSLHTPEARGLLRTQLFLKALLPICQVSRVADRRCWDLYLVWFGIWYFPSEKHIVWEHHVQN